MRRFLSFRTTTLFISIGLLYYLLSSDFHAFAQDSLICAEDIEKYCKQIKPGGGRLLNCLKEHETELSVSCRGKISELQRIIKDFEQACSFDITQFCKEIQPGGGRMITCLKEHGKELSPSCSAKLEIIGNKF